MKVVSVINYKGGVGKTTLTANLGAELANRGYSVLLIDLDPQASLTFSFITPHTWQKELSEAKTIKNWFKSKKSSTNFSELIFTPKQTNQYIKDAELQLIASHLDLINIDLELATQLGGANMSQAKENFLKVHRRLIDGIKELDENEIDVILIDCPPNFNIVTKNAIVASDYILIPAKPDYLSTLGIEYLKRSLEKLIKEYNEYLAVEDDTETEEINPKILGVVFTMVQFYGEEPISTSREYISQAKKLGLRVFKNYMRENKTIFPSASQDLIPVVLSSPRQDIKNEIGKIVDEFEKEVLKDISNLV